MRLELLAALNRERAARRACVLVTEMESGAQRLVRAPDAAADPLGPAIVAALRARRSAMTGEGPGRAFLTVEVPDLRMLIVGAVHISQALAPMARIAGYDVTILDPRTAFASPERFPDTPLLVAWPDQALPAYGLDRHTAFVALTHDPKIDEPALRMALEAGCFYVGALGSERTHAKRLARLAAAGVGPEALRRIHGPIGMDIGAASPPEIAVAILAEVIAARHQTLFERVAEAEAAQ